MVAVDGVQGYVEFADQVIQVIGGQIARTQDQVGRRPYPQSAVAVQPRINLVGNGQNLERAMELAVRHGVSGGDTPKRSVRQQRLSSLPPLPPLCDAFSL